MKKFNFMAYTLAVLMVGALIGGGFAWAFGPAARVSYGAYEAGIVYSQEDTLEIYVYNPKQIQDIRQLGPNKAIVLLK